jgi:hypothetical protein
MTICLLPLLQFQRFFVPDPRDRLSRPERGHASVRSRFFCSKRQHAPMKSLHVLLFSIWLVILGSAAENTDEPEAGSFALADVTNEALLHESNAAIE